MEKAPTRVAKRSRSDDSDAVNKPMSTPPLDAKEDKEADAVAKEAVEPLKKPRVETTSKPGGVQDASAVNNSADAEAILMRALEEAIERDAQMATNVDEDDDYDESD